MDTERKLMRAGLPLLIVLICISSLVWAQGPGSGPPPSVVVTAVTRSEIADRIEALGTLKANESVAVTTTVTEKITAIHFNDGQRVYKGDTLVEMTSDEEHALLEEARATLFEAQKQYKRIARLVETNAASKALLDQRKREVETARARLQAIESRMSDRLVKVPFSGVVGLRNISAGALLEPGDVITTLYDDSVMKLDFSVPATFLTSLKPGLPIEATTRAFGERTFEGIVTGIDNAIDPVTRAIQVRAELPNDEGILKPGLLMSVELFKNPRNAITLPEEALVMEGDRHYVFVVAAEETAEKREVTIGIRTHGNVEILQGVSEGERIITRGALNVRPGAQVNVMAEDSGDQPLTELLEQGKARDAETH